MIATAEPQAPSWPTESAEVESVNDNNRVFLPTYTLTHERVQVRLLTDAQVIGYTARLNDYARWVMLQLALRRGYVAAGFKTLREVMAAEASDVEALEGPWIKEMLPKLFNQKWLAGHIGRYHRGDPSLLDSPLVEAVDSWQAYFHKGLPYVELGLSDLKHVQGANAQMRKNRLEEVRKAMKWDIKALQGQRELAAELGI